MSICNMCNRLRLMSDSTVNCGNDGCENNKVNLKDIELPSIDSTPPFLRSIHQALTSQVSALSESWVYDETSKILQKKQFDLPTNRNDLVFRLKMNNDAWTMLRANSFFSENRDAYEAIHKEYSLLKLLLELIP